MQAKSGQPPRKKPGRVGLSPLIAPPRNAPFTGLTGLPARNTQIPSLTEHVAVAKAKVTALKDAGLVPEAKREAAHQAQQIIQASKPLAHPFVGGKPAPAPAALPARLSKPAVALDQPTAQKRAPAIQPVPSSPGRGALSPRAAAIAAGPPTHSSGIGLGGVADYLKGPLLGKDAASSAIGAVKPVAHAVDLGLGTAAAAGNESLIDIAKHPGKWVGDVKKRGLVGTSEAATEIAGKGLKLPNVIPSGDIVPAAGAAATEQTPQKLVAAGLTEAQTKRFREKAKKQGWYPGEIDGLVGLDLIKHAYSTPPPLPIRVLNNFGAGVIRTAGLVNVAPALAQEVATGHAGRAGKQLGEALTKQVGAVLSDPGQAVVSDPYGTIPILGGGLKTLGAAGGKIAEKAGREAAERTVTHAVTGEVIPRGPQARNLYTATGQMIADKATSSSAHLSRKADAARVDALVSDVSNATAPLHHGVQTDYAKAFKDVGEKRATVLSGINKSGDAPEKILAKYKADRNARQVKYWQSVVEAKKNLSDKDAAFLAAHRAMAQQTTGTHVELGRFSDTAGVYRSHQPLILSDAHAGDPAAQRVQALHEEWVKALRTTDDPAELAPLFGAYDHAVREYADTHLAAGGSEPTRVAYTPPPDTGAFVSPYRKGTGGKVRFNARVPKQKASTGGSFESGNYLVDPKVALRENLQAQRLRTSVGLTSDESLSQIGAVKAARGDERPAGYVFTPSQNPATVGKVISDLHDQPVGAHDYYHQEASIRDRLAKSLEHEADKTGEHAKTDGWFVPEGAWNRILDYTRPESRHGYDKFMRQYQRALISIYPSTMLGNTVGSTPMAMVAGAGLKSGKAAARSSSFKGDPTLVPFTTHGRGVAGNLAADARNPISRQMNRNRRVNVVGEDFSRDAVYFSHVLPGSEKRAKELGYENRDDYFRDLASGKVDKHLRDAGLQKVIKFVGDAAKPQTRTTKNLGRVILFPAWVQHMSKLMLVTLPLHHPRRMALINGLAEYGDNYRKEHGALPSWMQDFFPVYTHEMDGQDFTRVVGGSQLAPQGTAGGPFDTLTRSGSFIDRAVGLANPPVAAAAKTFLQGRDNLSSDYPVDMTRFALNQAFYTLPGASKFFPRTNMESTSLPWDLQTYTVPYRDVDGNKQPTSWNMRTGARPVGGWLGIGSRVIGLPLYDVPTPDSAINRRDVRTRTYNAKHPKKKG